jgi:hypothetical protein
LEALSVNLKRLSKDTSPSALFPQPPLVRFTPQRDECLCGKRLMVQKTRRKKVFRMTGPFIAHETVLECSTCGAAFGSDTLLQWVPTRSNVAYDVMVFIGRALFQRHRTTEETRTELVARNVALSASEVDYLGRQFIMYLARAHRQATPRIRQAMTLAGGYVLHLDATHEGDAPALMTGLDSLSKIVLANVKIPSEHTEHIIPFLRKIESAYGAPTACVHDMGTGICKALSEVFPEVADFICHFHFLRDIGKDYLDPAYRELRSRLRAYSISSTLCTLARTMRQSVCEQTSEPVELVKAIKTIDPKEKPALLSLLSAYSLALWALHGKHSGDGYGFPFDRPLLDFAERLLELHRHVPQLLKVSINDERNNVQHLFKLAQGVSDVAQDPQLQQTVEELRWRCHIFDSLRKAMRIAVPGGDNGLNDDGTAKAMSSIRQGVMRFRRRIKEDCKLAADPLSCNMVKQIDKYGDKLFADPIEVDSPTGPVTIYPQRTNNILEQFFRKLRRGCRRKTGNNSMHRALKTMLVDTPLIKNLDNPEYMALLLDGKATLEELFAQIGPARYADEVESQADTGRILPGFRNIINLPTLPELLLSIAAKTQQLARSN